MPNQATTLNLLKAQLAHNKKTLCNAHMELNRARAAKEHAEMLAVQATSKHPLSIMAQEHLHQSGRVLISLNRALEQAIGELTAITEQSKSDLEVFDHFTQTCSKLLNPFLKKSMTMKLWQDNLIKLETAFASEFSEFANHHNDMETAIKQLRSGRQRRNIKIKQFQLQLDNLRETLGKNCEQRQHNDHTQMLEEHIQKQLEKKSHCVREIQRYQHIIDNILTIEQQSMVVPAREHCEKAQAFIHIMQQQQLRLLSQIKMLCNPGKAVNDVLIDIDEMPKKRVKRR